MALLLFLLFSGKAFALYGAKVMPASEPFVASLHLKDPHHPKVDAFCSGVLISPTVVVTAGHCIDVMGRNFYSYSHGLIYRPELVRIKLGSETIQAKTITFSQHYFEGIGLDGEDLAVVELQRPAAAVKPLSILPRGFLKQGMEVTLIAQKKKVTTRLLGVMGPFSSLILSKAGGACAGDSGGAVIAEKNGQQMLAGILIYDGSGGCEGKTGYAFYPKGQF